MSTIKDIALKCGVTPAVVSTVLRNKKCSVKCSAEKQHKIIDTAKELGYRPNFIAQALVKKRSGIVGVVYPVDMEISHVSSIYNPIWSFLTKHGYTVFCFNTDRSRSNFRRGINQFINIGAEAVIFLIGDKKGENTDICRELTEYGIPTLACFCELRIPSVCNILPDIDSITVMGLEYLTGKGHRKIALLRNNITGGNADMMSDKCHELAKEGKIEFNKNFIASCADTIETAYAAFTDLYEKNKEFTAVLADSDVKVIGAMKAAKDCGLKLPEDILFAGINHHVPLQRLAETPFATIDPGKEKAGITAADLICKRLSNRIQSWPERITVKPQLHDEAAG